MEKKTKEYAKPFVKVVLLDDSDLICTSTSGGNTEGGGGEGGLPTKGRGRNADDEDW